MSTDNPAPRELATRLADDARALRDAFALQPRPEDSFAILADLIATQGLLTQLYEEVAAWHHLEAALAESAQTPAAVTATRLDAAAQRSELVGVWLDSALRSCAEAQSDRRAA